MFYILAGLLVVLLLALDFAICAGCTWLVCWGFGLTFSWPAAVAVWIIFTALCAIARQARGKS